MATQTPNVQQNYVLGRGELHFTRFAPNTTTGFGEHYLGNTPGFEFTVEEEVLEHYSSDAGLKVKDRTVTLTNNATGQITVDNISAETIALFLAATPGDGTGVNPDFMGIRTVAQAAITSDQTDTFAAVRLGRWYQIGMTNASVTALLKSYGIGARKLTDVEVAVSASVKTLGTDYELDAENGRIWIPETGGTIAAGATVTVTWQCSAGSVTVVTDGDQSVFGALRFISANAVGEQRNVFMPYVKLTPAGAIALKGDDWQQAQMNLEILKLNTNTPRIVTYTGA